MKSTHLLIIFALHEVHERLDQLCSSLRPVSPALLHLLGQPRSLLQQLLTQHSLIVHKRGLGALRGGRGRGQQTLVAAVYHGRQHLRHGTVSGGADGTHGAGEGVHVDGAGLAEGRGRVEAALGREDVVAGNEELGHGRGGLGQGWRFRGLRVGGR